MLPFNMGVGGASGVDTGDIGHSLRLRGRAVSAYANRTFGSPTSQNGWCWSGFVKLSEMPNGSNYRPLFSAGAVATSTWPGETLYCYQDGSLAYYSSTGGGTHNVAKRSTALLRDPSAWYHIFVRKTAAANSGLTFVRIWVNNVEITSWATNTYTGTQASVPDYINVNAQTHTLGRNFSEYLDGYLSRVCFVDNGASLLPTDFGYQNTEINEWVSKSQSAVKAVVDAGGTNSFMLDFDDATSLTTLGYDKSSKGNNWTLNNISLTAGSTYDWMLDVPGNSFATLNPLNKATAITTSYGNLRSTSTSYPQNIFGTQSLPQSGKFYCELFSSTATNASVAIGFGVSTQAVTPASAYNATGKYGFYSSTTANLITGAGGLTAISAGYTNTAGLPFKIAADLDAGKVWIGQQTTWWDSSGGTTGNPETGANPTFTIDARGFNIYCDHESIGAFDWDALFGQAPLHASATYHSAAGGYFRYAPPSGFKALCQANLPDPAILNPEKHFDVKLDTGANIKTTSEAVFPSNFFEWIKDRANANNHQLIDTVRGSSAVLQSNTTAAETTYSAPSGSSVGWVWKAGGAAVTNNSGSISSQVSANVLAGQSVVTYTGTGANATVGHGLGVAPKMVILKSRNNADAWPVFHGSMANTEYILLNTAAAKVSGSTFWNSTSPTSTVFSIGAVSGAFQAVALCFAEIPQFSKIGSYTGNGSADGPFVECGFKPKYVMIKAVTAGDSNSDWIIYDTVRSPYNAADYRLYANGDYAEWNSAVYGLDILSSGFKPRNGMANYGFNTSGVTYIFYAVADVASKYSLAR